MGKYSNNIDRVALIVLLGQSNEDGRGIDSDLVAPYRGVLNAKTYYNTDINTNSGSWQDLQYNVNDTYMDSPTNPLREESLAFHGNNLFLSHDYQYITGKPLYTIKLGVGGSNIHGNALETWNTNHVESLIDKFFDNVFKPAIKALDGKYIDFKGTFWFQGRSDVESAGQASTYKSSLRSIISKYRSDLKEFGGRFEKHTFYINESPDFSVNDPSVDESDNDKVRDSQREVGDDLNCVFLPNTDYILDLKDDLQHLTSAGQRDIANQRLAIIT